jgi:site-specific DNA-methyltransferase (cytosine-N4-specific)
MPLPAQWVNIDRSRVKDSVNVIWWLSKSDAPKADNRKVLTPYSKDMERLLKRQSYNGGRRPGGSVVNPESWKRRHDGAIPSNTLQQGFDEATVESESAWANFLSVGGSESASRYHRAFKALEKTYPDDPAMLRDRVRKHPARFPPQVPEFFIRFLTDEKDLVVDPFAGSNVTGKVAATLGRRWASFELHRYYLEPSIARFDEYLTGQIEWLDDEHPPLLDAVDISLFP